MSEVSGQIRELEQVGGFDGKAVTLAEGRTLAGDSEFYKKSLAQYAAVTPAKVRAARCSNGCGGRRSASPFRPASAAIMRKPRLRQDRPRRKPDAERPQADADAAAARAAAAP